MGGQASVGEPNVAASCHQGSLNGQHQPSFWLGVQVSILCLVEAAGAGVACLPLFSLA